MQAGLTGYSNIVAMANHFQIARPVRKQWAGPGWAGLGIGQPGKAVKCRLLRQW